MHVVGSTTAIHVPSRIAANLEEIGRQIDDEIDEDIDDPRTAALRMFVTDYMDQFGDQFQEKDDGLYVYDGGSDDE